MEEELIKSEWENTGTSPTKNGFFDPDPGFKNVGRISDSHSKIS